MEHKGSERAYCGQQTRPTQKASCLAEGGRRWTSWITTGGRRPTAETQEVAVSWVPPPIPPSQRPPEAVRFSGARNGPLLVWPPRPEERLEEYPAGHSILPER